MPQTNTARLFLLAPFLATLGAATLTAPAVGWSAAAPITTTLPAYTLLPQPEVPQIPLAPGLTPSYNYAVFDNPPIEQKVPAGFTPIFNGKDLTGWHISTTARHGHTPDYHVQAGMIIGTQNPVGRGGLLVTDKKYKNYELYFEAKADWGADSGIFLRTTEEGAAYQVTMDYLPGGAMGSVIQEGGLIGVSNAKPPPAGTLVSGIGVWKHNDWNTVRIRIEGDIPHVQVWINDQQVADFTDVANHAVGNMTAGPFALQMHGGNSRWLPGDFWRWKNIGVKELP
ncbi:MAG: hypothetical protein JWM33_768 [Caulobacteraceae bacterium]|nr:hypothetical protein [Caulobacteraceae bacterium]